MDSNKEQISQIIDYLTNERTANDKLTTKSTL